ncbi:MAG: translation elongation factor Ts [Candidatus Berkelbacteria bacterium]|nr:translation elongation factor Ts [Candidatus Berkelbacteria bacterium]
MEITAKEIAALREKTGLPMMEVKSALLESNGDEDKAIEILRKRGMTNSNKRADRATANGVIDSYVHSGRIGVLTEVLCETDFVAKNDDFKNFAHELSLQIAATAPKYVKAQEIPIEELEAEKKIYAAQAKGSGKPENIIDKIVDGKLETYYASVCLLNQPYFRDSKMTISDLLNEFTAKTGEKIVIARFVRFDLAC